MTGLLRLVSTAATVLILAGFALFAIDETGSGSTSTVSRIADANSSEGAAEVREEDTSGIRGAIDDVNDVLLAPFDGIVSSSPSAWVRNGVPTVLGFLAYGLLLRLLANVAPQRRRVQPLGWDVPR